MDARDWMAKGYVDGRGERYEPPNHHIAHAAYDHGQQSARDDKAKTPSAPFKERVAAADAIIEAWYVENGPPSP